MYWLLVLRVRSKFYFFLFDTRCRASRMAEQPLCAPVICNMHCRYGFVVDEVGCDVCKCVQPSLTSALCSPVLCRYAQNFEKKMFYRSIHCESSLLLFSLAVNIVNTASSRMRMGVTFAPVLHHLLHARPCSVDCTAAMATKQTRSVRKNDYAVTMIL